MRNFQTRSRQGRVNNRNNINPQRRVQSGRVASNLSNPQIVKRSLWQRLADIRIAAEVTDPTESYTAVGSHFLNTGLNYRIREFLDSSLLEGYDMYRITRVEVFGTKNDASGPITCFASFDPDDSATPTWAEIARRQNVRTTTLKINEPRKLVASFSPVVNYNNTGPTGVDSPQNVVATGRPWIDSAAASQSFNGLKLFATCNTAFSLNLHARVTVEFKGKI